MKPTAEEILKDKLGRNYSILSPLGIDTILAAMEAYATQEVAAIEEKYLAELLEAYAVKSEPAEPQKTSTSEFCVCPIPDRETGYDYCNICHRHVSPQRMELLTKEIESTPTKLQSKSEPAEGTDMIGKQIKQLKEFHTAFNLPQRDIPTIIPPEEFKLRHKILMEEVGELSDAYFVGDIIEVADAIMDCLYILIGTALQFGIADKLESCFDEVHRSNMSKLGNDGYPIMREDGKVMKSENYTQPDLKRVLNEPTAAQQQPTAEGAEEIIDKYDAFMYERSKFFERADAIKAMNEFAALHAQRLADKMVEERLKSFLLWLEKEGYNLDFEWDENLIDEYLMKGESK